MRYPYFFIYPWSIYLRTGCQTYDVGGTVALETSSNSKMLHSSTNLPKAAYTQRNLIKSTRNQLENGEYNLISVWFNRITKRFLCVHIRFPSVNLARLISYDKGVFHRCFFWGWWVYTFRVIHKINFGLVLLLVSCGKNRTILLKV